MIVTEARKRQILELIWSKCSVVSMLICLSGVPVLTYFYYPNRALFIYLQPLSDDVGESTVEIDSTFTSQVETYMGKRLVKELHWSFLTSSVLYSFWLRWANQCQWLLIWLVPVHFVNVACCFAKWSSGPTVSHAFSFLFFPLHCA